jgi:hypothetical protein
MMFEWLDEELRTMQPGSVHSVEGPASASLAQAIRENGQRFPRDYIEFVLRYGNAKFFNQHGYYLIVVFASPRHLDRGLDVLFQFGIDDDTFVFFRDDGSDGPISPVVCELDGDRLEEVSEDFSSWLKSRYDAARRQYTDEEWQTLIKPEPFSPEEQSVVSARRNFRWTFEGVTERGLIRIRVANLSQRVLPFFTLSVRSRDGETAGAVWLPVGDVQPGGEKVLEIDCYSNLIPPQDVVLADMPEPTPVERDLYWEFRSDRWRQTRRR